MFESYHKATQKRSFLKVTIETTSIIFILAGKSGGVLATGGLRPRKLILGIPTYGRGFTLEGQFYGQQRPPAKAGSSAGQFTGEAGFLAYHEVRLRVVYNTCK